MIAVTKGRRRRKKKKKLWDIKGVISEESPSWFGDEKKKPT